MDEREATLGAYRIRGRLGSGGMGEVFLAYDERLRRHVAIKRIRDDMETTPARRRRFRREARAAAGLSHPAIVQIHDILTGDDGDHIVMEYVEGRSLQRLIADGDVDAARAVDLARQVAGGLAAAHERGIVHRDLKTENVMVMPDGRARILDFGLAKPSSLSDPDASLTREGTVLGTLRVMSPEQAAGRRVDARSDLYSLGILLYEMLTGSSPFLGDEVGEVYERVLNARAPSLHASRPELPAALSALVEALLEKEPAHRPRTAGQVADALSGIARTPGLGEIAQAPAADAPASDAPTLVPPADSPTVAWTPPEKPSTKVTGRSRRAAQRRLKARTAATVAVAVAAVATTTYLRTLVPEPRRVLVLPPEVTNTSGTNTAELGALGVREAALGALGSLQRLEPIDPSTAGRGPTTRQEIARATAADEVIASTLDFRDEVIWVSLHRIDAEDDHVIWSSGLIEIPYRPEYYLQLADTVASFLRRAYEKHPARPGSPGLEVRDEDYAVFLELQRRSLSGQVLDLLELDRVDAVLDGSPRFLPAYIYAAEVARTHDQRDRARDYLDRARKLAPDDPRPLFFHSLVEIDAGRLEEAESIIAELELLAPGDIRGMEARARLIEGRGRLRDAASAWRRIVEIRPSGRHLLYLAQLHTDLGEIAEARELLSQILEISPRGREALVRLAYLEMVYGDLGEAEDHYRKLVEIQPQRSSFTNLGSVLYLRRDFAPAAESFRRALELAPGHHRARLNLADAEHAAGHEPAARALYRELCDDLRDQDEAQGTDARLSLTHAQCLVHLDKAGLAVEITQRTLKNHPENANYTLEAALVYALAGERHSAVASAQEALARGVQKRWFETPAFDSLRSDPAFQALLSP